MVDTDRHWARFGDFDPYLKTVKTLDPYKRGASTTWDLEQYLETGERYVTDLFETIDRSVSPQFKPRIAVDFGCSVGRVALALARRCDVVIGVDVAPGALREGAENAQRLGLSNLSWRASDDDLSAIPEQFDFFHSYNVLQHLTVERGLRIVSRALNRLAPSGVIAVHVPYADQASSLRRLVNWAQEHVPAVNRVTNLLRRRAHDYPQMLMKPYPLAALFALLAAKRCTGVHCKFIDQGRYPGVILLAQLPESRSR